MANEVSASFATEFLEKLTKDLKIWIAKPQVFVWLIYNNLKTSKYDFPQIRNKFFALQTQN